jgi:hypothetical protein
MERNENKMWYGNFQAGDGAKIWLRWFNSAKIGFFIGLKILRRDEYTDNAFTNLCF